MASRNRGYCFTINNYDYEDMFLAAGFCEMQHWVTYMVVGFEVGENGTSHMQGYVHFSDGKTMKQVLEWMPRAHLEIPRATGDKFSKRYEYCMKDDDYWEFGERPKETGVTNKTNLVVEAIHEGKTYEQLMEIFPSYMIHHGPKVKAYIEQRRPRDKMSFFITNDDDDNDDLPVSTNDNIVAIVTELSQLEAYSRYDTVIFYANVFDKLYNLWPKGVPVTYKYGYQLKTVNCKNFIIATPAIFAKDYKNYKYLAEEYRCITEGDLDRKEHMEVYEEQPIEEELMEVNPIDLAMADIDNRQDTEPQEELPTVRVIKHKPTPQRKPFWRVTPGLQKLIDAERMKKLQEV